MSEAIKRYTVLSSLMNLADAHWIQEIEGDELEAPYYWQQIAVLPWADWEAQQLEYAKTHVKEEQQ